jgi:hypothetical protein
MTKPRRPAKKLTSPATGKKPSRPSAAKKPSAPGKAKPFNPFGEKKRPAGKKFSGKGPKDFKRRRPEENLEIILTDKELGEVTTIKRKLAEMREYKKILAEDGQKPDQEDKTRESELIVRLLRIEKNAKMAARQRAKAAKTEAFREAEEKAKFAKEKKKSRQAKFHDDDDNDDDADFSRRDDDDGYDD